jgi:hypothetical protein
MCCAHAWYQQFLIIGSFRIGGWVGGLPEKLKFFVS